jgi:hypothetical protein
VVVQRFEDGKPILLVLRVGDDLVPSPPYYIGEKKSEILIGIFCLLVNLSLSLLPHTI